VSTKDNFTTKATLEKLLASTSVSEELSSKEKVAQTHNSAREIKIPSVSA
jgi:hypothetical protein